MKRNRFMTAALAASLALASLASFASCSKSTEETTASLASSQEVTSAASSASETETSTEATTTKATTSATTTETSATATTSLVDGLFDGDLIGGMDGTETTSATSPSETDPDGNRADPYGEVLGALRDDYVKKGYILSDLGEDYRNGVGISFRYNGSEYAFTRGFRGTHGQDNVLAAKIDDTIWNAYSSTLNPDEYRKTESGNTVTYSMIVPENRDLTKLEIRYDRTGGVMVQEYSFADGEAEG